MPIKANPSLADFVPNEHESGSKEPDLRTLCCTLYSLKLNKFSTSTVTVENLKNRNDTAKAKTADCVFTLPMLVDSCYDLNRKPEKKIGQFLFYFITSCYPKR